MYLAHQAVHKPLGLPPEGAFSEEELALLKEIETSSDDSGHLRKRFTKVFLGRGKIRKRGSVVGPVAAASSLKKRGVLGHKAKPGLMM